MINLSINPLNKHLNNGTIMRWQSLTTIYVWLCREQEMICYPIYLHFYLGKNWLTRHHWPDIILSLERLICIKRHKRQHNVNSIWFCSNTGWLPVIHGWVVKYDMKEFYIISWDDQCTFQYLRKKNNNISHLCC